MSMTRSLLLAAAASTLLFSTEGLAQARVTLIDAGAEPRQPLRYQLQAGRSERVQIDSQVQISLAMGGQSMPLTLAPPVRMTLDLASNEVAADGSARISYKLVSLEAVGEGQQVAQMNQALAGFAGISGWYRIDPRGNVLEGQVDPLPADNPAAAGVVNEVEQAMQRMSAPLPEQAVGPGARWQVTQSIEDNAMKMTQTSEFTLRSRNGQTLELDMRFVEAQMDSVAGLPPGAKLESVEMKGGGSNTLPLDGLIATGKVDADIAMSIGVEGQGERLGMNINVSQTVTSK
jgi:hypothetical protein